MGDTWWSNSECTGASCLGSNPGRDDCVLFRLRKIRNSHTKVYKWELEIVCGRGGGGGDGIVCYLGSGGRGNKNYYHRACCLVPISS